MPRKQTLIARRDLPIFVKQENTDVNSNSKELLNLQSIYPRPSSQTASTTKTADFSGYVNTDIKLEFDEGTPHNHSFTGYESLHELDRPQVVVLCVHMKTQLCRYGVLLLLVSLY